MIKYILQTKETQEKYFYSYYLFPILYGVFYFFQFYKSEGQLSFIKQSRIMATFGVLWIFNHVVLYYSYIKCVSYVSIYY